MKVMKDNIWNKFFHKKKLQKRKELKRLNDIVMSADDFLPRLKECDSLLGIMHLHKEMWGHGLRNKHIGPCQEGIFRTRHGHEERRKGKNNTSLIMTKTWSQGRIYTAFGTFPFIKYHFRVVKLLIYDL